MLPSFSKKIYFTVTFPHRRCVRNLSFSAVWSSRMYSSSLVEYCWVCLGRYFRWLNFFSLRCFEEPSPMCWLEFVVFCTSWNLFFSGMVFRSCSMFSISNFKLVIVLSQNVMICFLSYLCRKKRSRPYTAILRDFIEDKSQLASTYICYPDKWVHSNADHAWRNSR